MGELQVEVKLQERFVIFCTLDKKEQTLTYSEKHSDSVSELMTFELQLTLTFRMRQES